MTLMNGFPPNPNDLVTLANWRKPPFNRWSFNHVREIVPSATVRCDRDAVTKLEASPASLSNFSVDWEGDRLDLDGWIDRTFTDSLVILKKGKVAFEYYAEGQDFATPHIWMSVSKSLLGLLIGTLVHAGQLKLDSQVRSIIPELKASAFAEATVRDLLDMRVGVSFDEDYHAADGAIIAYRKAQLWDPLEVGEAPTDLRAFFSTLTTRDGLHGDRFHYASPNTDLLGWIAERASGRRFPDLASDLIWKPLGAECDAYITIDRFGAPRCAGGFCAVPRDLARLGRLFVTSGNSEGRRVVPRDWIQDIVENGVSSAWKNGDFVDLFHGADMHYRSKWYVARGDNPLVFGVGVFGQNVFVDIVHDVVIAKLSSQPLPLDQGFNDLTMNGIEQIRAEMRES